MGKVERYYDEQCEQEWRRLETHRLEFELTKRALDEHIAPGSRVLDAGGGPGRYSIHLAGCGCRVTLMDLSERNVARALEEAGKAGVALEAAVHGNVLELASYFPGQEFDAVLCMGPLYHLLGEGERAGAVRQCLSVLREGGIFAASFITAYAPIIDLMRNSPERLAGEVEKYLGYLRDGRYLAETGLFTEAYFIHPGDVEPFMAGFPLEKLRLIAAEGLGALLEPALTALPEEVFAQWLELFYRLAGNPETFGACEHLLYVGRKVHCQRNASGL